MRAADWARLTLLSLIWGGAFYFAEVALDHVDPFTIVMTRVGIAALVVAIYCRIAGIYTRLTQPLIVGFLVMGFFNNAVPFSLITWGQTEITGSLASIINATTPLFTVAVAHFWPKGERATPLKLAGVAAGICGVVTLIGIGNLGEIGGNTWGELACLGAAFSYAIALLYGRRFAGVHPLFVAAGMMTASTLMIAPLAFLFEAPYQPFPPASALLAMAALAVLAAAIAYFLYFSVLQSAGATNASLVTFMIPVSAILLGVTLRGETLEPNHVAGLALILFGLALVDGRLFRRKKAAAQS